MKNKRLLYTRFITITTIMFLFEIVLAHFLKNDLNLFTTPLSLYAVGNYWFLISSGLFFIAVNYALLGILFIEVNSNKSKSMYIGTGILFFVSANTLALTIFQTDTGNVHTLIGRIHVITAHLHFAFLPVSTVFLYAGLKGKMTRTYRNVTLIFTIWLETGVLVLLFRSFSVYTVNNSGFIQKGLIVMILFWILYSSQMFDREFKKVILLKPIAGN